MSRVHVEVKCKKLCAMKEEVTIKIKQETVNESIKESKKKISISVLVSLCHVALIEKQCVASKFC